ncbi:MAG TPA: WhiB family transcriptional regulator [Streptosporangiaceae bacterium]|nr:WhiB family transcriptional regulator [Streptosporangiaceae bacterium]
MGQTGLAAPGRAGAAAPGRPGDLTDRQLMVRVTSPLARCAGGGAEADEWFPVATRWTQARAEAARALALCEKCPVRADCLELSLRQWSAVGRYGVWGGLLEAERAAIRKQWLGGVSVTRLLDARQQDRAPYDTPP